MGENFAKAHETEMENYDFYCGLTCQTVEVDGQVLADRLSDLISNPALRRQLGEAGQARAWEVYDWAVVYRPTIPVFVESFGRTAPRGAE